MKNTKRPGWSRLDNAAKVFPALANKKDSRVFRFACQLTDNLAKPDWHHHHDHFMDSNPNVRWKETLEHAEKIGLGNREYELIKF